MDFETRDMLAGIQDEFVRERVRSELEEAETARRRERREENARREGQFAEANRNFAIEVRELREAFFADDPRPLVFKRL